MTAPEQGVIARSNMVENESHDDVLRARDESQDGPVRVDVTLIDEMLRLTPTQRRLAG
jgi:hypothetical protein